MKYKNNPLNIRYSPINRWQGLSGHRNGFCEFVTLDYGIRAAFIILARSYRKKGIVSVKDIIERFAPASENNTSAYLDYIFSRLGWLSSHVLTDIYEYIDLIQVMSMFESRTNMSCQLIRNVIIEFNLDIYEKD